MEDDLPLLRRWLAEPHIRQWWDDPDVEIASIREHIASVSVEPLIVEHDAVPIAYLQIYDPHLEDGHPYQGQPVGTLDVDISIGVPELLDRGRGTAIMSQLAGARLDAGAPRPIIDPDPANGRAIRAYEKAGFSAFDTRTTVYGCALLMKRDAPEKTRKS